MECVLFLTFFMKVVEGYEEVQNFDRGTPHRGHCIIRIEMYVNSLLNKRISLTLAYQQSCEEFPFFLVANDLFHA